jgi:hypothetical protein
MIPTENRPGLGCTARRTPGAGRTQPSHLNSGKIVVADGLELAPYGKRWTLPKYNGARCEFALGSPFCVAKWLLGLRKYTLQRAGIDRWQALIKRVFHAGCVRFARSALGSCSG